MEYECPCCKEYDGITYKKIRDEYAYKMADDIVSPYAHKGALEYTKKSCPNRRDHMFNEHYLMYYRVYYEGMFDTAVGVFEEHYIANAVEQFEGDIKKTCDTFEARYNQYKRTGCALYRGGLYDTRHQQLYPELETALDTYYMANHKRTPQ
jgi:hypothetical protein